MTTSRVISIHSFRGGTGKSNTTANLAVCIAATGRRVGIIDTDIQSPGIHVLFDIDPEEIGSCLNDYLWGRCPIEEAAYDVSERVGVEQGAVFLIPSSLRTGEIAKVLRDGYDVSLLNEGLKSVVEALALDVLLIDTHPGLNEETLLSIALSDTLIIVLRPDHQDYQGTAVTVEVARKLEVPQMTIVVNKAPPQFDQVEVARRVEEAYGCEVAAVIPHVEELMTLASGGVFVTRFPNHPLSQLYRNLTERVLAKL